MKTFEEKFTAWVDGELKGKELAEFEVELAGIEDADLDRVVTRQLGDLLRDHGRSPVLQNVDFFNHQIMQRIHVDMPTPARKPERRRGFVWSFPRLALAGAFALVAAFGVYQYMSPQPEPVRNNQVAEIIKAQAGDPDIPVTAFYSQKNDATVLWLDWKNTPVVKRSPQEKHTEKSQK